MLRNGFVSRTAALSVMTLAIAAAVQGCYMEVTEDEDDADSAEGTWVSRPVAAAPTPSAQLCADEPGAYCWADQDFRWRASCQEAACRPVKVYAHYMLTEELGEGRVVHVEAFDNEHFQGAPRGTVRIDGFPARSGGWRDADIFLAPGEYYLRAYMTTADDEATPYVLGGMSLVEDQPVGVFGALSGAQMVRVPPRRLDTYTEPVHIYLDKLFKRPGSEPDTRAHLRVDLRTAQGLVVPDGRSVRVRLHPTADLATTPAYDFAVPSEALLVSGRVGRAEFVSPSLAPGDYVVSVFLDLDGDAFMDDDEPQAVHTAEGLVKAVRIVADRTESVALTLATPAPR